MYQLVAYIKFLFTSINQHGVHSPFVYNFVTKCLYDKTNYEVYKKLRNYRKSLQNLKVVLQITELGEGSKKLNKQQRKVSEMVSISSSSVKNTKLLYRVSKYFKFNSILELGTSLGLGTYALALANKNSKITTIEGCPNTSNFTKSRLTELKLNETTFLNGEFKNLIPTLKEKKFDFVFFDGHHNKSATIKYFESLLPKTHNGSVFVFDDIYWSKGMTEAWEFIKAHQSVTVSVDCFHLGFIFFRKEQAKEHFKIRV